MSKKKFVRHPQAVAMEAFQNSDQWKSATDPTTVGSTESHRVYFENRIIAAFQAGWDAAMKSVEEKKMNGMTAKKQRRDNAKRFTEDGLPRDANEWTSDDWRDLHVALETVKRKVGKRHACNVSALRNDAELA